MKENYSPHRFRDRICVVWPFDHKILRESMKNLYSNIDLKTESPVVYSYKEDLMEVSEPVDSSLGGPS